jgi:hypothetical protein
MSKAGVAPQVLLPILPQPRREDMGMEVDDHCPNSRGDLPLGQESMISFR